MESQTRRVIEDATTIRDAGWIIGCPSWADVDVIVDGERVLYDTRTDHRGHVFLSQNWFETYGSGTIDIYIQQTYEERHA